MNATNIIMTCDDHSNLTDMVEIRRYGKTGPDVHALERLANELARARLVAAEDIPPDVITMDTRAKVRDLDSGEILTFTLSWPEQADAARARINVLAPLGMALLGCRVGQRIEWPVPNGVRRFCVEKVMFQPEKMRSTRGVGEVCCHES